MKQARDGYKMTELGEIPVEWELMELQDVMQKGGSGVKRGPFGGALKKENFVADGFAVYEQQHVIYNQFNNIRYFITSEKFDELSGFEVLPEDILISCSGTVGKVSIVPKRIKRGVMNQALLRFRLEKNLADHTFLYFLLISEDVQSRMLDMTHGSTIKNMVAVSEIKGLKIGLPSLKEQQKIAEILSTVDEQIENTEQLIEKTKALKKGLMQQLLTKGIGHTEFKQTELGEIPVEWDIKSFQELLDNKTIISIQDGNHGERHPRSSDYISENKGDAVPFIMASDLKNGSLDYNSCNFISLEQAKQLRVGHCFPNDILFSHKGSVGKVALVSDEYCYLMLTPQVTLYRIGENSILHREYLKCFMQSDRYQENIIKLSAQSTRNYIGISEQKKQLITMPTLEEQQKIASILSSVDEQIKSYEQEKEKYLELKKGLMQQLLTGQIRVTV
ncbi:restriction endonuclease subunit S [Paenibacillus sp. GYB006]|uniref:restriction endonuclease subunit S n=1 Tax=Paenibacillus sp. GYB006 TaxID=2994394 RepID=UPI002F96BAAF